MKRKYFTIYICAMLLMSGGAGAQTYSFRHFGVENGLLNNYVNSIAQDSNGFVWITSVAGLNRFDGHNFTAFKDFNADLPANSGNALLYDETDNRLWIATIRGLCMLDCATNRIESITAPDSVRINNIVGLSKASDGGIWIINHHGGVVHYDKQTKLFDVYADDRELSNWNAFDDGNGNLYIAHAQEGMSIVDIGTKARRNFRHVADDPNSIPGNTVYAIFRDRSGNVWTGTNQGLGLFNPATGRFRTFKHDPDNPSSLIADPVYCIREMHDGTLWIGCDIGGISILDLTQILFMNPHDVRFVNLSADDDDNSLSSNNIRNLFQDSFGNIWIGNYGNGIDFISHTPPVFHILPYAEEKGRKLKNKPGYSIFRDSEQQFWIGSDNELALVEHCDAHPYVRQTFDITPYTSRKHSQISCIQSDYRGTLLLGGYDEGVLKFDCESYRVEQIKLDIKNIDIITSFRDDDGTIWIGSEYGVYTYRNGKIRKEEHINSQLQGRSVYGILRDRQGKLWIGTYSEGVAIFDADNKRIDRLHTKAGFFSNDVNSLYRDSKGGVWIATRFGLGYVEDTELPRRFQRLDASHGLQDEFVRAVQEDSFGRIWISLNSGVSMWNSDKQRFDNYDRRDGIPAGNFVSGSAGIASDGTIYFGSLDGVCYFNPADMKSERPLVPVRIVECKLLNKQIESHRDEIQIYPREGNIHLSYSQNSFRISFSTPDCSQSQHVEYSYMMEGFDNIWYGTDNSVTFRNIPPGKYTFKVRARLKNREWNESQVTATGVTIHPPVWLAWYAKLFYVLLACLLLYAWMRFYKRKLNLESSLELEKRNNRNEQELNQERLRFYTNITHELRTPLTLILGPLEDLLTDANLPAQYSRKIKTIHDSAIRLLNLINRILEFRKTETHNRCLTVAKADLGNLVTEIGLRYKELNRNDKVTFHISIETATTTLYFDAEVITSILNNLLSNAVKYTPEGDIRIVLTSVVENNSQYTEIRVSDTGYGISAQDLPRIFDRYYQAQGKHQASGTGIGLALVKSLAELHHGALTVESKEGEGTTFGFRILTENTYPDAMHSEVKQSPAPEQYPANDEKNTDARLLMLVVEDNDDIREYIVESFSPTCRMMSASNGSDGLSLAQKHIPDIIVSDVMMPVMDGIEFCRAIKEDIRTSHIPVILLTAKDSIRDKEEGYESGADSYLTKPLSAKLLRSRVNNLLESRRKLARQITVRARKLKPDKCDESLKLSKLDNDFLTKLTTLVEENLDSERLDIAFVVEKMNMSQSTFYRKVKGLTGISANEFIRKVRLKNSLQLLLSGEYNISEAAYKTGFNDLRYFRECFKEEYGMSPSDYLKKSEETK